MRKKIFAVAMTAMMAIASTFTAFAATTKDPVDIEAFASANSGNEELKGDFDVTYTFDINAYKLGTNSYENVMVEIFTESETVTNAQANYISIVCNGNAWYWNGAEAKDVWADSVETSGAPKNECSDTELKVMKDAKVVLNIKKEAKKITFDAEITGADKSTATWKAEVNNAVDFPDTLYTHLSGEQCKLSNIEFVDNKKAAAETKAPAKDDADEDDSEGPDVVVIVVIVAVVVVVVVGVVLATKKKKPEDK